MALEEVNTPRQALNDLEYAMAFGEEAARSELAVCLATTRLSTELTQKALADRIGKTQPYVAKLEGGEANPTLATIGHILAAMGKRLVCSIEPLLPPEQPRERAEFLLFGANEAVSPDALGVSALAEEALRPGTEGAKHEWSLSGGPGAADPGMWCSERLAEYADRSPVTRQTGGMAL